MNFRSLLGSAVLASHGGWGFGDRGSVVNANHQKTRISPEQVAKLSDFELRTAPIFDDFRNVTLYQDILGNKTAMDPEVRANTMAESIPVLSPALGCNFIPDIISIDLNQSMKNNGWPFRKKDGLINSSDWRHSDVLYVAPVYVCDLIKDIINIGGLK